MVLLAYLPVDNFENAANPDEKAHLKNELTHRAMEIVTRPLQTASKDGVVMQCADGRFRHGYPIIAGVIGDWPEQCMMACTSQSGCPKCVQKEEGQGDYRRHAQPRNNRETLKALSRYFKTRDLGELDALGLKPWWPWWANLPYVDFSASLMPDTLHQLHQGMVKTHLVRWTRKLVGKRQVDHCFMAMPKAEGMWHLTKGISKLKGQWTGWESREVAKQLLPVSVGQPISFIQQTPAGQKTTKRLDPDLAGLTCAILEFSYRSHASRMADEDVSQLEKALEEIHQFKDVIVQAGLLKMGTPDNYSTEAPEHLHIECAKRGWRASNKVHPTPQMVKCIQRYEALQIQRAYMNTWLGVEDTNQQRKRKRKSRIVFGEDVEGPSFKKYGAHSADMAGADKEEDQEAEELERLEEEDEVAEGLRVQLEKRARARADAGEHMVYPDPTLSIAVNPNAGRMKGLDIISKHGATDFIWALQIYLKKNMTHQSLPDFFLPTKHHSFLVWNWLYLHHCPLPFDPEHAKRDVIRAQPETHFLGSAFDVALLLYQKEAFGLDHAYQFLSPPRPLYSFTQGLTASWYKGYRAGRVRAIFSLPKELAWLCSHPLISVELFNPFSPTTSPSHGLHTTSHVLTPGGKWRTAVVSIYDVAAACHLAPQCQKLGSEIELRLYPDLLDESRHFFLNHFYNHYIFGLVEHWQSARARAAMWRHD
ncbi:hypothetical protein FRC06_007298 [Ceratobasidium sp. 370]|nr:hypothetical protein FRC06_007298 [Ceratobasidium sp. 370]